MELPGGYLHRLHLAELKAGEARVQMGREIIARHKELRQKLIDGGAEVPPLTDRLLELLEISQSLAEDHLIDVKLALRREQQQAL